MLMKRLQWLAELSTYALALLFLFTAVSKLLDFRHFVRAINNQPFDNRWTPVLVVVLPLSELLTAGLLLWPRYRSKGLLLSALLMFIFTVYVGLVTFHFYERVPCACAGVFQRLTWTQHFVFNVFCWGLALGGLRIHHPQQRNKPVSAPYGKTL